LRKIDFSEKLKAVKITIFIKFSPRFAFTKINEWRDESMKI